MDNGKFRVGKHLYDVSGAEVNVKKTADDVLIYIEIVGRNDDMDHSISEVGVQNDDYISTGVKEFKDLIGKKFNWDSFENDKGETAGTFFMAEFEDITQGCIEILDYKEDTMTIKWVGKADPYWSEELGLFEDVPFEVTADAEVIMDNK